MRLPAAIACALLCACGSAPELGAVRTPVQSLRRPLDPDLTTAAFAARTQGIARVWHELAAEPGRAARLTAVPARLMHTELARSRSLPDAVTGLLHDDAARAVRLHRDTTSLWDRVFLPEGDREHRTAAAARLLGVDRAPLGEIDDQRHRTDPDDDRPEASLWHRLSRRLRF